MADPLAPAGQAGTLPVVPTAGLQERDMAETKAAPKDLGFRVEGVFQVGGAVGLGPQAAWVYKLSDKFAIGPRIGYSVIWWNKEGGVSSRPTTEPVGYDMLPQSAYIDTSYVTTLQGYLGPQYEISLGNIKTSTALFLNIAPCFAYASEYTTREAQNGSQIHSSKKGFQFIPQAELSAHIAGGLEASVGIRGIANMSEPKLKSPFMGTIGIGATF